MNTPTRTATLLLALLLALAACYRPPADTGEPEPTPPPSEEVTPFTLPPEPEVSLSDNGIAERISAMTLEEKAAAVFMVPVSDAKLLPVGGVVLYSNDVDSAESLRKEIAELQDASPIPLFIGADEEGGRVSRFRRLSGFPRAKAAAEYWGNAGNVYNAYLPVGAFMAGLGFNVNFAPVADVLTDPDNSAIGDRSYGSEPDEVSQCVQAASRALREHGVLPVIKHFPGHGGTGGDSHKVFVSLKEELDTLLNREFVPFIEAGLGPSSAIMTGHIALPKAVGDNIPATLNPAIINGILREDLGFEGLVFTDALNMESITRYYNPGEAAILALQAGCDVLLVPDDLKAAHKGVVEAVKSGRLDEEVLDTALFRQFLIKSA